jgi:phosphoribosylformylglycinamidine cyclo-ligase
VGEILKGTPNGQAFDLVGMAIGTVPLDKIIVGNDLDEGDVIIGLASSGIHSNGLSLARKIFFEQQGFPIDKYLPELGRTIGEELLEPTHIYVPEVMEMLNTGVKIKALFNITGDGLLNLLRFPSPVGLVINNLMEPQPIFNLIQEYGNISDEEMYTVFNMGLGFCVIANKSEVGKIKAIADKHGVESYEIGGVVKEPEGTVMVEPKGLVFKK